MQKLGVNWKSSERVTQSGKKKRERKRIQCRYLSKKGRGKKRAKRS